jgi:CRP-like cAMP-binding protein
MASLSSNRGYLLFAVMHCRRSDRGTIPATIWNLGEATEYQYPGENGGRRGRAAALLNLHRARTLDRRQEAFRGVVIECRDAFVPITIVRLRSMALAQRSDAEAPMADQSVAAMLHALPIFSGISIRRFDKVLRCTSFEQVRAGVVLIQEGVPQQCLYILVRGLLQVFTHSGADEATLTILSVPTILFADVVLRDVVPIASVRTLEPSCMGRLTVRHARRLFASERAFADAITQDLAENGRNILRECKNARSRNAFQRLVAWILAMIERADTPHEITLPLRQGDTRGAAGRRA